MSKIGKYKTQVIMEKCGIKSERTTLWDIEGAKIVECCGTCDCCTHYYLSKELEEFPYNLKLSDMDRDILNMGPLNKWCKKHSVATDNYGWCPGWEED